MGCVLFHKKPKTLSLKLPLKGNFDQSKMPLHVSRLTPRWLPSYMGLTNMSENSSYDWMKGRDLCQTFLHPSNGRWLIRRWISYASASTAAHGRSASACRPSR